MTLNANRQAIQQQQHNNHFGTTPDMKRQVGLLAGKTAKRRLNELRSTSRLPRAHHDFLSDHNEHYPDDDFDDLHKPMRLSWDEIFVEDMLGMGGFGSVCLVTCPKLRKLREREGRAASNKRNANGISTSTSSMYDNENENENDNDNDSMMNGSFAMTADDSSFGGSMMLSYASTTTAATGYHQMLDPNKYYACKSLSNKTIKQANVRGFVQAAADLVQEAFLLSHINPHPNLVRLYGIPKGSIESAFDCASDASGSDLGYFLILEALGGGILSDKVFDWKQKQANLLREQNILRKRKEQQLIKQRQQQNRRNNRKKAMGPPSSTGPSLNSFLGCPDQREKSHTGRRNSMSSGSRGTRSSNGSKSGDNDTTTNNSSNNSNNNTIEENLITTGNPLLYQIPSLEERLDIALQIASGMQHLHAHGIVFRDLKPHNVGLSISFGNNNTSTNTNTSTNNSNSNNNSNSCSDASSGEQNSTPPLPPQPTQLTWRLFDFGLAREVPVSAFSSISNAPRSTTMNCSGGGNFSKTIHHSEYQSNFKSHHKDFSYGYNHSVGGATTATDPSVCYGKAGSLRYMAPETMGGRWLRSSKHQNSCCFATFGSDVYAFAIVLWELVGLTHFDKKYDNNPEEFESAVCDRGHRPAMDALDAVIEADVDLPDDSPSQQGARKYRHSSIRELVHACWREDYRQRPTFEFVVQTLKEMLPNDNNSNEEVEDDSTIATDNFLVDSELDSTYGSTIQQHQHQHNQFQQQPPSYLSPQQPLSRLSNHSYTSSSNRSSRRRLMRKISGRTLSSRSMLSATSMSNHSMAMSNHSMGLEDVFEVETEHSNSGGSNRSSDHKASSHNGKESLDSANADDEDDTGLDFEEDCDDDESMNNFSVANDSLMNESVITISNRNNPSSRYLEYCSEYNDDDAVDEAKFEYEKKKIINHEYKYDEYKEYREIQKQKLSERMEDHQEQASMFLLENNHTPTAATATKSVHDDVEGDKSRRKKKKNTKKHRRKSKSSSLD